MELLLVSPVKKSVPSLDGMAKKAVEAHRDEITDLNTIELDKGLDSNGKDLGTYKNFDYKDRFRPVDLLLTGRFRGSIFPKTGKKNFEMVATDEKTDMLQDKYGDEILGIKDETEVSEVIKETFVELFRKKTLG